jgi:hypothetical protein
MATFRCKRSGNTVSFTNENDIAGLRLHEGYDEIIETPSFLRADDDIAYEHPEVIEQPIKKRRILKTKE